MALLNFAKTYEEVSDRLDLEESSSGDYVLLVFTRDGHIITHGVDYTPLFSAGKKGLVPGSSGEQTEFIRGNGKWLLITTQDLPIATSILEAISSGTTNTTILNTQLIIEYVSNSIAANDAMVYKGTITYSDGQYTTHTTEGTQNDGFPTICKIGDTYRVTTQGTYGGLMCESGDLITCIKDGNGDSLNTSEYWTVILTNINGLVKHSVNGVSIYTYSNSSNTFNIYAPTTGGTLGQVLISNGSAAPTWVNQNTIIAGDIADSVKRGLLTAVSLSTIGEVSVTVGGTTKTSSPASGTWGINISGVAGSVKNPLSTGAGLSMGTSEENYNGSVARTMTLLPATSSTIGGVIIDSNSERKTITVGSNGNIYLTLENIINALGYIPGNKDLLMLYSMVLANSASSTNQISQSTSNPFYNLVLTLDDIKTVVGSLLFIGSGHTSILGNGSKLTISSTWRDITIGGLSIGSKTLNFVPTGDIYIKQDSVEDNIQDVSFGLSWYNISTEEYEIA